MRWRRFEALEFEGPACFQRAVQQLRPQPVQVGPIPRGGLQCNSTPLTMSRRPGSCRRCRCRPTAAGAPPAQTESELVCVCVRVCVCACRGTSAAGNACLQPHRQGQAPGRRSCMQGRAIARRPARARTVMVDVTTVSRSDSASTITIVTLQVTGYVMPYMSTSLPGAPVVQVTLALALVTSGWLEQESVDVMTQGPLTQVTLLVAVVNLRGRGPGRQGSGEQVEAGKTRFASRTAGLLPKSCAALTN